MAGAVSGFWELSAARGGTGYGPLPIRHSEIEAWARIVGSMDVWESRLIREMDQVWMEYAGREIERRQTAAVNAGRRNPAEDPFDPTSLPKFDRMALREMAGRAK